jgi:hypothetical protein
LNVYGDAGLRGQLRLAPLHDVVLQRAHAPVVDECAMLEGDATVVGEQLVAERVQAVGAPVNVLTARRLAGIAVRFECADDRVDIASRQSSLVVGHNV